LGGVAPANVSREPLLQPGQINRRAAASSRFIGVQRLGHAAQCVQEIIVRRMLR